MKSRETVTGNEKPRCWNDSDPAALTVTKSHMPFANVWGTQLSALTSCKALALLVTSAVLIIEAGHF